MQFDEFICSESRRRFQGVYVSLAEQAKKDAQAAQQARNANNVFDFLRTGKLPDQKAGNSGKFAFQPSTVKQSGQQADQFAIGQDACGFSQQPSAFKQTADYQAFAPKPTRFNACSYQRIYEHYGYRQSQQTIPSFGQQKANELQQQNVSFGPRQLMEAKQGQGPPPLPATFSQKPASQSMNQILFDRQIEQHATPQMQHQTNSGVETTQSSPQKADSLSVCASTFYSQHQQQAPQCQKSSVNGVDWPNFIENVKNIPVRFTQKARNATFWHGKPLIDELFSGDVLKQQSAQDYSCCGCSGQLTQRIEQFLDRPLSYAEYMMPALAVEYLARGFGFKTQEIEIGHKNAVFSQGADGSDYCNISGLKTAAYCFSKEFQVSSVPAVCILRLRLGELETQCFGWRTVCRGDIMSIQLERPLPEELLGSKIDKVFFANLCSEDALFLQTQCTQQGLANYMRDGVKMRLSLFFSDEAFEGLAAAVAGISQLAPRSPNVRLLLGMFSCSIERQLQITGLAMPQRRSANVAFAEVKKTVAEMGACGKTHLSFKNWKVEDYSALTAASSVLIDCAGSDSYFQSIAFVLLNLVLTYKGHGRVLCCAATERDAAHLALNAYIFGLSDCSVYVNGERNAELEGRVPPNALYNIIIRKILSCEYVGSCLTAQNNAFLVAMIAAGKFDYYTESAQFALLARVELYNASLVITTCANASTQLLNGTNFAATVVYDADALLEPECMQAIFRAPEHVVLLAGGLYRYTRLSERFLHRAGFGKSLYQRVKEIGLPVMSMRLYTGGDQGVENGGLVSKEQKLESESGSDVQCKLRGELVREREQKFELEQEKKQESELKWPQAFDSAAGAQTQAALRENAKMLPEQADCAQSKREVDYNGSPQRTKQAAAPESENKRQPTAVAEACSQTTSLDDMQQASSFISSQIALEQRCEQSQRGQASAALIGCFWASETVPAAQIRKPQRHPALKESDLILNEPHPAQNKPQPAQTVPHFAQNELYSAQNEPNPAQNVPQPSAKKPAPEQHQRALERPNLIQMRNPTPKKTAPSAFWNVAASSSAPASSKRKENLAEAVAVRAAVMTLISEIGLKQQQITVVTPYDAQIGLICAQLAGFPSTLVTSQSLFASHQNDAIILSCVNSAECSAGALTHCALFARRVQARARRRSIIIGDAEYWRRQSGEWAEVIASFERGNALWEGRREALWEGRREALRVGVEM